MTKTLYLECGQASDKIARRWESITRRQVAQLPSINLLRYDVVIIPSYSNQDLLNASWSQIHRFLKGGGVLCCLGAVQDKTEWLPYCTYRKPCPSPDEVEACSEGTTAARLTFSGLVNSAAAIRLHSDFYSHGSFLVEREQAEVLIARKGNPMDAILAVVTPATLRGKLVVTTLDPDYHAHVSRSPDGEDDPIAAALFGNLLRLSESLAARGWTRALTRSWAALLTRPANFLVLISAALVTLACWILLIAGIMKTDTLGVVASFASILSLVVSLVGLKSSLPSSPQ